MSQKIENIMPNIDNKQGFKSQIYTFGLAVRSKHYQLQKNFSKIELNLRQGCKLFTVYVFGSFCWLYVIHYTNKTNQLRDSKFEFLFQDILFETLPLFSQKGSVCKKTKTNPLLISKEPFNSFDTETNFNFNTNEKSVNIELTPFFSEKLQNYIGRKALNSREGSSLCSPKELIFFARKPLFIEVKETSSISSQKNFPFFSFIVKKLENKKLVKQAFVNRAYFNCHSCYRESVQPYQPNSNNFLKKQILTQKKAYNLSGTSMIMDPEIDFLPRKLEECVNFSKKDFPLLFSKKENKKSLKEVSSLHFKPELPLNKSLFWCNLIKSKTAKIFLDTEKIKPIKISKSWVARNSFELHSLQLPLAFTKQNAMEGATLIANPGQGTLDMLYKKNQHQGKLIKKTIPSKLKTNHSLILNDELLQENFFLKKKSFWKSKNQFMDILNQPRLESGFYFPNALIVQNKKDKLKEGLGLVIRPQLISLKESIQSTAQRLLLTKKIEEKKRFQNNTFLEWSYEPHSKSEFLFYNGASTKHLNLQKNTAHFFILDKHTDLQTKDCFLNKKLLSKGEQVKFILSSEIKTAVKIKSERGDINRKNQSLIGTNNIAQNNLTISRNFRFSPTTPRDSFKFQEVKFSKEKTFIERFFSYKRNAFCALLDAPENFFGTPYLKLGERFTIEKLKNKSKISTLYNIHSGNDVVSFAAVQSKPFASMGTSLKTVFGKKQFATSQNQNSKKITKVQNLITNARLVTNWSTEPLAAKNSFQSFEDHELKENHLLFSNQEENKNMLNIGVNPKITGTPKVDHLLSATSRSFAKNSILNKVKISKLFNFNLISGKANRNIKVPFKYYNPGIKRERNIEDTMLTLEGYRKSRLFPLIHNNLRGIATINLSDNIELENLIYTDQDVDLQSILGGMRQRTEKQRIAENVSEPSQASRPGSYSENLVNSKEKNQEKEELIKVIGSFGNKKRQQNKKQRLSNYYPLCTSLAVCPQEAWPEKALGVTNIIQANFTACSGLKTFKSRAKQLKGSIQTKGFYFEKLFYSQCFPFFKCLNKEDVFLISPSFLAKILFFACTWYSYKLLATPLSQSTQFLPATFTEAIGLESFQQKYRIIKSEKTKLSFSFKNLAGAEKTLSQLRDLIWTFRLIGTGSPSGKQNLFTFLPYIGSRFGQARGSVFAKSRNRLLLAGPPGTGKTLLVKALAAEANLPVIVQPVSSLRMISGVENPVSALFHVARQIKPCIVFLDELDTLGNDVNLSTNNSTAEQKLGIRLARKYTYTLLLELDGLTCSTQNLLIIGATNRLETLNPALMRAGRFDTILDFQLPSQEVRTALFSFYLGTEQPFKQSKQGEVRFKRKTISFKKINFKLKKSKKKAFWLESYLAGKCSGLSHASIGTIINESALESMLMRTAEGDSDKPLHSLDTLDKAINSVKTLSSRVVENSKDLSFSITNQTNILKLKGKGEKIKKSQNFSTQLKKSSNPINPFPPEFLVNRVYQIVGSLIFNKKSQEKNSNNFSKNIKKLFYKTSWFDRNNYKGTQGLSMKNKDNIRGKIFGDHLKPFNTKKSHLYINEKALPINRKDLQNLLLQEYSGMASLSLYTATKPLTFKILTRAGLYQDPNYVAAILLTDSVLTLQNSFDKECFAKGNLLNHVLNKKSAKQEKTLLPMSITKENFGTFSGFVSERNLPKVIYSDAFTLDSSLTQAANWCSLENSKSVLFWKNRKVMQNSFSSFTRDSVQFTKHHKQTPQTLLMDLKTVNDLITGWFRVYFSRPFFRYDTYHYIENKEYYPKNNYFLKPTKLFQRNVSTLSHTTHSSESNLGSLMLTAPKNLTTNSDIIAFRSLTLKNPIKRNIMIPKITEKKGKFSTKENLQGLPKVAHFSCSTMDTEKSKPNRDQLTLYSTKELSSTKLESKTFYETKESLYLALVASIFHKGIQFFQKNRELTDYCAHNFLRYGALYDFYLEAIIQNF